MNFRDLIHDRIWELGDDNHTPPPVDPYRRRLGGIAIGRNFDISTTADGRIRFGDKYDTHHLRIDLEDGSYELIYVRNQDPNHAWMSARGSFYVHEFAKRGGLAARTFFFQTEENKIRKIRMTNFNEGRLFGDEYDLVRDLRTKESGNLKLGVHEPTQHWANIIGAIAVSPQEAKTIAKNQAERRKRREELARDLRSLDEARHRAAQEATRIFLQ